MMQVAPNIGARMIYFKEDGVQFASNYAEKAWIPFCKERVQDAYLDIARELPRLRLPRLNQLSERGHCARLQFTYGSSPPRYRSPTAA
jgi:hypothetical protein